MIERVGIWIRVSTEMQAATDSPEHHLYRASAYAAAKGWTVAQIYRLDGVSGKTVHDHPEMERMLADIESGAIQGLIFSSLSRLARKKSTLEKVSETFKKHQAAMVCLDQGFDTSTHAGELFYSILAAFVEFEGNVISERVVASVPVRAKMGKRVGGQRPFGYVWTDQGLQPHPEEAPIRELIFELYLEHRKFSTVTKILNDRKIKTGRDAAWSRQTVRHIILNPLSKGVKLSNYTKSKLRQQTTGGLFKPEDQWVYSDVPAIVSEEKWNECNSIADTRKHSHPKQTHSFGGVITCGHCGGKMHRDSDTSGCIILKYRCRNKCKSAIAESTLDKLFNQHLHIFINDTTGTENRIAKLKAELKVQQSIYNKQKANKAKSVDQVKKIEADYFAGDLSASAYERLTKSVESASKKLSEDLRQTESVINDLNQQIKNAGSVTATIGQIALKWNEFDSQSKNEFARLVVKEMVSKDGELSIDLELPLSDNNLLINLS